MQLDFFLVINKQGKLRLSRWYVGWTLGERAQLAAQIAKLVVAGGRSDDSPSMLELPTCSLVCRRYASLYFVVGCVTALERTDKGSIRSDRTDVSSSLYYAWDVIHRYVETLDAYFGNVCELDLVFNYAKAFGIWDEMCTAGVVLDLSTRHVLKHVRAFDERVLLENKERK
jgi:hypothetical protein